MKSLITALAVLLGATGVAAAEDTARASLGGNEFAAGGSVEVDGNIRRSVFAAQVKSFRAALPFVEHGIFFMEVNSHRSCPEGCEVRYIRKAAPHGRCSRIVLRHGWQTQDQLNSPQHGCSGIHGMIHKISFDHPSGNVSRTTVCIYVVGAVLRVIFHDKDNRLFPDW